MVYVSVMKTALTLAFALLAIAAAPVGRARAADTPAYVATAVADPARPKEDHDNDALRDPADTLAFAGVRPGMVVGELFPGGGYYTRLLSTLVGAKGKLIAVVPAPRPGAVADAQVGGSQGGGAVHGQVQGGVGNRAFAREPVDHHHQVGGAGRGALVDVELAAADADRAVYVAELVAWDVGAQAGEL